MCLHSPSPCISKLLYSRFNVRSVLDTVSFKLSPSVVSFTLVSGNCIIFKDCLWIVECHFYMHFIPPLFISSFVRPSPKLIFRSHRLPSFLMASDGKEMKLFSMAARGWWQLCEINDRIIRLLHKETISGDKRGTGRREMKWVFVGFPLRLKARWKYKIAIFHSLKFLWWRFWMIWLVLNENRLGFVRQLWFADSYHDVINLTPLEDSVAR